MTSQYGAYALHAGLARLHARMRVHTTTLAGVLHARTHAHTDQKVMLIAFSRQQSFGESVSILRYTYSVCLVMLCLLAGLLLSVTASSCLRIFNVIFLPVVTGITDDSGHFDLHGIM
jgi:hypothetical protein